MPASSSLRFPDRRAVLLLGAVAVAVLLLEVAAARLTYRAGFPLDDAWIHQTYARNLALRGEWSFLPGVPSGGSTAPLWSAWLALGYLFGLGPLVWAYASGALLLWALGCLGEWTLRTALSGWRGWFPWAGLFLVAEWHMAWAAGSGMETLLAALLFTLVLARLAVGKASPVGAGVWIGLGVWVRPDAVTLLGPGIVTLLLWPGRPAIRIGRLAGLAVGFLSLFLPYLLFQLALTGEPWPTTFYAKQAEYAELLRLPFGVRLWAELRLPWIGAGALLLPGVALAVARIWRERLWGWGAMLVWFLGFAALYAWRLPVTYQYGRYLMPAMPAFFLIGLLGALDFLIRPARGWIWRAQTAWSLGIALLTAGFLFLGARAYARDTAYIESEMVETARWVDAHAPPDALVAAHDIGALGYFAPRPLLDLAGLISPEVIPFLRDEARLADYLDRNGAQYLVAFPDWYPTLTARAEPVFVSGSPFGQALGRPNMTVYRWPAASP